MADLDIDLVIRKYVMFIFNIILILSLHLLMRYCLCFYLIFYLFDCYYWFVLQC